MSKVLVIAFDGLDKELIDKFQLNNVPQYEYGFIENRENIKEVKTSELFTSFITGLTWEEHGIQGIKKWNKPFLGNFIDFF